MILTFWDVHLVANVTIYIIDYSVEEMQQAADACRIQ